jgi:uncharacterized protein involved in response to NO
MPTLFNYGFRVFFLSSAAYAVLLMAAWMAHFALGLDIAGSNPLAWHAHEVLFGVVAAAIAGFLLTAVPNWTSRPRLHGGALMLLWAMWLAARIGHFVIDPAGADLAALALRLVDLAFLPGLALVIAAPILESGNRRNFVMVALLLGLFVANLLHGIPGTARAAAFTTIDLVTVMMALIAGRITPLFTRNWLMRSGRGESLPRSHAWLDGTAMAALVTMLVFALFDRDAFVVGVLALLAAGLHLLRLVGWRGWRTGADPLVWVLHLGYAWIVVGLVLRGLGILLETVPAAAWLHAIGVGAMGTLILGVMARVSLGHTGRALALPRHGGWMFGLITLAAAVRIGAALGLLPYMVSIQLAGVAWIAAFMLFLILYIPVLFAPRADGKPG